MTFNVPNATQVGTDVVAFAVAVANTSDVIEEIRRALSLVIEEDRPWGFVIIDNCTASTYHEPLACPVSGWGPRTFTYNRATYIDRKDAKYIEAVQPLAMRKLLAEFDAMKARLSAVDNQPFKGTTC